MIDQQDWDRLARFAAGECSAADAEATMRWVDESPERREALAFIRDVDRAAEAGRPRWNTDASWDRLVARRQARERPPLRLTPPAPRRAGSRGWWAAAASIVIVAGTLAGAWRLRQAAVQSVAADTSLPTGAQEHATARGERSTFQLPDGTPVVLAAASRLRYPASYHASSGQRDVYLEGQALFQVKHDPRRPFVVHTAHGVTEDLGTRFAVREYAGDTAVEVVVAEGRVALRPRSQARGGAQVQPGELGRLLPNRDPIVQSGIDLDRYLAWTQGRLVFDEMPLRDAFVELSRWYALDFVLADSTLGSRHLTTVLSGEAIDETLSLLGSTLDLRYERQGRRITFFPRHRR